MTPTAFIHRMRKHHGFKGGETVGIRGRSARIDRMNDTTRTLRVTATTDDLDLEREVVLPQGRNDHSYFLRNKAVFLDHHYATERMVAKMRITPEIRIGGELRGWACDMQVLDTPLALDIWAIIRKEGIGSSIGFRADNRGAPTPAEAAEYPGAEIITREWEWLEQSLTAFPCNVACQTLMAEETSDDDEMPTEKIAEIERFVSKGLIRPETGYAMGLPAPKSAPLPRLVVRRAVVV